MAHLSLSRPPVGFPMVKDVISWLKVDGFYNHQIGWKSGWVMEKISGSPPSEPFVLASGFGKGEESDEMRMQREFDINAGLREATKRGRQQKYVKKMLREHQHLIPDAIRELDRQLLQAGLDPEELQALDTGHASDAYTKLRKLEDITGTPPPPPRIRFQVMSDIRSGPLLEVDIWLPRTCMLVDFEERMVAHQLVRDLRFQNCENTVALPEMAEDPADGMDSTSTGDDETWAVGKEQETKRKRWTYKIVVSGEETEVENNQEAWTVLSDQDEFTRLMRQLVRDDSKFARVCHESTLERPRSPPPPKIIIQESAYIREEWLDEDGEEFGNFDMTPEDFDISVLRSGGMTEAEKQAQPPRSPTIPSSPPLPEMWQPTTPRKPLR